MIAYKSKKVKAKLPPKGKAQASFTSRALKSVVRTRFVAKLWL